jgi:hypothetical protein
MIIIKINYKIYFTIKQLSENLIIYQMHALAFSLRQDGRDER